MREGVLWALSTPSTNNCVKGRGSTDELRKYPELKRPLVQMSSCANFFFFTNSYGRTILFTGSFCSRPRSM